MHETLRKRVKWNGRAVKPCLLFGTLSPPFVTFSYFQFGRSRKTGFSSATRRSSSTLGRCGRAPSSTLQRFTGRRSSDPSSRLPLWLCSGLVVVGHRALCNGFSTRSSEFIRHFPTSALFQYMPRGPQPRVTSCNEALYCIPSAALLPPVRPISG